MGDADEMYGGDSDAFDENGELNPLDCEEDDAPEEDEETDADLPY